MWLFFRDDDLGWEPERFERLARLFRDHDQRLNAAAIPTALDAASLAASLPTELRAHVQVVVHGYRHENHEVEGKKCEFGPSRARESVREELLAGRARLADLCENFFPGFVPPWNRIACEHLPLLEECGYRLLSRDDPTGPRAVASVPELNVSLDLHTRKDGARLDSGEAYAILAQAANSGRAHFGVMLHHARMEEADYAMLDELLRRLSKRGIRASFYSEMLPGGERLSEVELSHV